MARILAISSQVARGSVGLSIIVPALQSLGHEVIALPTVVLSNHPGHPHVAGTRIEPTVLHKMLDALEANGWLAGVDGILTGYLPSVEHVAFAAEAVRRVKAVSHDYVVYLCDPVLGDDPKGLYIDRAAAEAIRDQLIPLCVLTTPNRFEASFLKGMNIRSASDIRSELFAWPVTALVTSVPTTRRHETLNVMSASRKTADDAPVLLTRVPLRPNAPHGTGDLFSALALSAVFAGRGGQHALAFATAGVDATLAASAGHDQLLVSALPTRANPAKPWPVETA